MQNNYTILVYEHGWLEVGLYYGDEQKVLFEYEHYLLLAEYLTQKPDTQYYNVYLNKVRFANYVGVIKVKNLTIEILPKTDRHNLEKRQWQNILLEMLTISFQVRAKITTRADIHVRQHSVLETYLQLFLEETEILLHEGLVKKYRIDVSNKPVLKGKLLIHQHVTKNLVHADRFYVSHQVYDLKNVYNSILMETLNCINSINVSDTINRQTGKILLSFPECKPINISEKLFDQLIYDRKTERYRRCIELAKIILLNYHPDLKGGNNDILAIMFDMNLLWESFIYKMLSKASQDSEIPCEVKPQQIKSFWRLPDKRSIHLKPDIIVDCNEATYILDTKWKYENNTSAEDIRQMYAYGQYWGAQNRYLMYPDKVDSEVKKIEGIFYDIKTGELSTSDKCGLIFIDLLNSDNSLNKNIGVRILTELFNESE